MRSGKITARMVTNEKQIKLNRQKTRRFLKTDKSWINYRALTKIGLLASIDWSCNQATCLRIHAGPRSAVDRAPDSCQRSWVRYPVWPHTFVSPSADSRRTVVSFWRKYVHEILVNRLGGLSLPKKSVVRLTDRPDMTLDVYRGRKTT